MLQHCMGLNQLPIYANGNEIETISLEISSEANLSAEQSSRVQEAAVGLERRLCWSGNVH